MIEVYTNQYHADKLDFDLNENIITFLENDLELVSIIPVLKIPMGNAIVMVAKVDEWMFLAAANDLRHWESAQALAGLVSGRPPSDLAPTAVAWAAAAGSAVAWSSAAARAGTGA